MSRPISALIQDAQQGSITEDNESPDEVQPLMLRVLRYADSIGLKANAHVYSRYRYCLGSLIETCVVTFYFWIDA